MSRLLQSGSIPSDWENRISGPEYYGLSFLSNLSALPNGVKALESLQTESYFVSLLNSDGMERLKAAVILVNVFMQSQSDRYVKSAIRVQFPHILPLLDKILIVTISKNTDPVRSQLAGEYFHFGMLRLRTLSLFLRNLALDENNHRYIFQTPNLLLSALKILRIYAKNEPELCIPGVIAVESGGGGGRDHGCAFNLLEFVIYLFRALPKVEQRLSLSQNFLDFLSLPFEEKERIIPENVKLCSQILRDLVC